MGASLTPWSIELHFLRMWTGCNVRIVWLLSVSIMTEPHYVQGVHWQDNESTNISRGWAGSAASSVYQNPARQSWSANGGSTIGAVSSMLSKFGVTTYMDTFMATLDPSQPSATYTRSTTNEQPPATAPIADRLEFLHSQLDRFGTNDLILNRFCLLGYVHRRQGGVLSAS